MHIHPLHRWVQVECLCCHILADFNFTSKHNQVVCRGCERHQGDGGPKLIQRDQDHIALWRSESELAAEEAGERESKIQKRVEDLERELARSRTAVDDLRETVRRGFEQAPLAAVEKWLIDEAVAEANSRRDSAYRSRDHAFRVIWALDRLHGANDDDDSICVCGTPIRRCREAQVLAPIVDSLMSWENKQIDRLRRGLECGLPDEHPDRRRYGSGLRRTR